MTAFVIFSLPLLGLAAGFLGSIVGGGGLVALPCLVLLGIDPKIAAASLIFADTATFGIAACTYVKHKKIIWPIAGLVAIISISGAILGSQVMHDLDPSLLTKIIGITVLALLPFLLLSKEVHFEGASRSLIRLAIATIILFGQAVLGSIAPAGGATVMLLVIAWTYRIDLLRAYASLTVPELCFHLTATVIYTYYGYVDFQIGMLLMAGAAIGSYLGSKTALKGGHAFLKLLVAVIASACAIRLLLF